MSLVQGIFLVAVGILCGCSTPRNEVTRTAADPLNYLASFKNAAKAEWPNNRSLTVVTHGHSVPAGYFKTPEVRALDAYPNLLREALAKEFPNAVINVIVTAVGGEASPAGAARFTSDVLKFRPDVITIDYALNDRTVGLEQAEKAWRFMIESAIGQGASVILLTPTPDTKGDAAVLKAHADQVRRLATEYRIGLVDSAAVFANAKGSVDGLMAQFNHPNRAGHELVAIALMRWFR